LLCKIAENASLGWGAAYDNKLRPLKTSFDVLGVFVLELASKDSSPF
jgi:hypothetical protein